MLEMQTEMPVSYTHLFIKSTGNLADPAAHLLNHCTAVISGGSLIALFLCTLPNYLIKGKLFSWLKNRTIKRLSSQTDIGVALCIAGGFCCKGSQCFVLFFCFCFRYFSRKMCIRDRYYLQ